MDGVCRERRPGQIELIAGPESSETEEEEQVFMPARRSNGAKAAAPEKVKQIGRYIVADPKICHGKLTFRGTRIFVSDVLEQVEAGEDWDTIIRQWHGSVTPEAIAEALRFARQALLDHVEDYAGCADAGARKAS